MIGALFGFVACLVCAACDVLSWWWLLWGSLIGLFLELAARVGCGQDAADAVTGTFDLIALSGSGDGGNAGGGWDGGDCGGGDCGGGGDGGGGGGSD